MVLIVAVMLVLIGRLGGSHVVFVFFLCCYKGAIRGAVPYERLCRGICTQRVRGDALHLTKNLQYEVGQAVQRLGGVDTCSGAEFLFCFELHARRGLVDVLFVLLAVASGESTDKAEVFVFADPVIPVSLPWTIETVLGLRIALRRIAHVAPEKGSSADCCFNSRFGVLDFVTTLQLGEAMFVQRDDVQHVVMRQLLWEPVGDIGMDISAVVGDGVKIDARRRKTSGRAAAAASEASTCSHVRVEWHMALEDHDVVPASPVLSHEPDVDAEAGDVEAADEDPLLKTGQMLDLLVRDATNGISMDQAAEDEAVELEEIEAHEQGRQASEDATASSTCPTGDLTEELWASLEGELDVSIFFVQYNKSYIVKHGDIGLGVLHTLGNASFKSTCRRHKQCVLFTNVHGLWEQCFRDHVAWLHLNTTGLTFEEHQEARVSILNRYTASGLAAL